MKIMLVVDYYSPFNPGGSEWSVHYLAKSLKEKGVENLIVTPNYGTKSEELVFGIKVLRFPNFKKSNSLRSVISPIWQNNPLFFIWSGIYIYKIAKKEKIDILHIHGKFLVPGVYIVSKLLRIPFLVTIRDKQLLCSYGKCFFEKKRYKACGWWEYILSDMPWFYKNYVKRKGIFSLLYTFISAIWTRFANNIIVFFVKRSNSIITISHSQKKYLEKNGFKNILVIYNSCIIPKLQSHIKRKNILFAGKLSLGKGVYKLLKAIPDVIKKHQEKFIFVGGIEEKKEINKAIKKLDIKNYVKFLEGVDHFELQRLYQSSKLVVMPSVYPEAFGRVALEALAAGTPVIVSDRGGLPEIVKNNKNGLISDINPKTLAKSINKVLESLYKYINFIVYDRDNLRQKFESQPVEQHVKLYKFYFHNKIMTFKQ